MSTIVRHFRKGRGRLILGLAILAALVFGLPWVELTQQAKAANPPITPVLTLTASAANPLAIPNDTNGNPIPVPASLVVSVAEEITFKAKGVPGGGTYWWSTSPLGSGGNPPFYWKFSSGQASGYFPANSNGESIISKRFAIPGIYRARVIYRYPDSADVTAYVTVMVVDHTRVNFATNEYDPGDGNTGKPWSETPEIYPAYTSNYDSDNDGLPDAWETEHFGSLSQNWAGDPDFDGLSNARELAMGTDPNHDRDRDGIANIDDRYPDDFYNGIMPVLSVSGNMQVKVVTQDGVPVSGAPLQLVRVSGNGYFQGGASAVTRNTSAEGLVSGADYVLTGGDAIKVTLASANGLQNVWLPANVAPPVYTERQGDGELGFAPPALPPTVSTSQNEEGIELVGSMCQYLDYRADVKQIKKSWDHSWSVYDSDYWSRDYDREETTTKIVTYVAGSRIRTINTTFQTTETNNGETNSATETSVSTTPDLFSFKDYPCELNNVAPYSNVYYNYGSDEHGDWENDSGTTEDTSAVLNVKLARIPTFVQGIDAELAYVGGDDGLITTVSPRQEIQLARDSETINIGVSAVPGENVKSVSAVIGPFITSGTQVTGKDDCELSWSELVTNSIYVSSGVQKSLNVEILASMGDGCGSLFEHAIWRISAGTDKFRVSFGSKNPVDSNDVCEFGGMWNGQRINIKHVGVDGDDEDIVTISYTDGPYTIVKKSFNVRIRSGEAPSKSHVFTATITNDEAASPRYRKIGLTGVPLADEKPQAEEETDEETEETYVDALTRELRHSTTDVYVPVPASQLALSVRRNVASETWSYGSGLGPEEDPTLAFGPAWRSNLCPHIRLIEQTTATGQLVALMNITARKQAGVGQSDPNYAFVTDEDGSSHRFAIGYRRALNGTPERYFVPMPTSRHEQDSYQMTLEPNTAGDLVFTKRFGNTLNFSGGAAIHFHLSGDRIVGSKQLQYHEYHRLMNVKDRFGNQLDYSYSGSQNLVPSTIAVHGRTDLAIRIVQNSAGRVTRVYDPNGNETVYSYEAISYDAGPPARSASALWNVTQGGSVIAGYTYQSAKEEDYRKYAVGSGGTSILPWDRREGHIPAQYEVPNGHIDVKSISDAYGNTTSFDYETDTGFSAFTSEATYNQAGEMNGWYAGSYMLSGIPFNVTHIRLPNSRVVEIDGASGGAGSSKATYVTDAKGNARTYAWSNAVSHVVDQKKLGYEFSENSSTTATYTYFRRMTITHAGGGEETYDFDISSGLALSKTTDHSGNVTRYGHGEDLTGAVSSGVVVAASVGDVLGLGPLKFSEPTSQIDALNRATRYAYGPYRVMDTVIDPSNNRTDSEVDELGRRTVERVKNAGGEVLKETGFAYHPSFKSFLTRRTAKNIGKFAANDPEWVQPMSVLYEPDTNGRIGREATDMNGNNVIDTGDLVTSYTYDRCGNKLTATGPAGLTTWFRYDTRHRLVGVTNPDGTTKTIVYDKRGRKVLERDENGHASGFIYDEGGRLVKTVRDMNGNLTANVNAASVSSILSGLDSGTDLIEESQYNDINLPVRKIDARGYVTVTDYDHLQRPTMTITPGKTRSPGDVPDSRETDQVTEFFYDGENSGASCFDSSGFKPTRIVDPRGYTSHFSYDDLYRPTGSLVEYASGLFAKSAKVYDPTRGVLTDTYQYRDPVDATGATVGEGEPNDPLITHSEYDELYRPTFLREGYGTAIAGCTETRYTSTGLAHKAIRTLNASESAETDTEYDAAGRPNRVTGPPVPVDGTATMSRPVTVNHYNASGTVAETIDPRNNVTFFTYDARDRLLQTIAPSVYDPATSVLASPIISTSYDAAGNAVSMTNALGNTTITAYDAANRPETVTAPSYWDSWTELEVTPVTRNGYDLAGNVLKVTDPNGSVTLNTYDSLGRLSTTKTNPKVIASENAHPDDIVTSFQYDKVGNKTRVVDGENQVTTFEFDGLNRPTSTHWDADDARRKSNSTEYDAAVVTATVDARNVRVEFTYDGRFRATGSTCAAYPADNEIRSYDIANRLKSITYTAPGDLRNVSYEYDKLDRATEETSAGFSHHYGYDIGGNRTLVEYLHTGRRLVSGFDALNRLSTIRETLSGSVGERVTGYQYDLAGQTLQRSQPNGAVETSAYDELGRRRFQQTFTGSGSMPVSSFFYHYDAVGNVTGIEERYGSTANPDRDVTNTYDRTYRLGLESVESLASSQTPAKTTATEYQYDRANNRTLKTVTVSANGQLVSAATATAVYGNAANGKNSNQLVSYDDTATGHFTEYTYDANGNRQTRSVDGSLKETCIWDSRNRLTSLVQDGGAKTYGYAYDYRMRRVQRDESAAGGENTICSYSGGTSAFETVGTAVRVEYVRGSDYGGGTGGVLYTVRDGLSSFNAYNSRGDVVAQTNSGGSVTWEATYEAFGTRTTESGTNLDRQKANTKEEDPTGLLNEGFRYRDLQTGMFISRDPLGFVDGPNVYTYVRQNPWTFFDPLGLKRYKGSDASDEDWGKLSEEARESLKEYRESGGTMKMLKDAGFDLSQEFSMSSKSVKLTTAGEVEFQMWTQGDKTLYTRDVWGAAEGGGAVAGAGVQGWDNWGEFKQDINMDAFWRGKGGEAFQTGIGAAAGLAGGLGKPTLNGGAPNGANVAHAIGRLKAAQQQASMASVNDKLMRYLLNAEHSVGGEKAKFFSQALGYTTENSGALARQLVFNPKTAVQTAVTQHGTKFNQVIDVVGANGRTIPIKTAWIQNNDGVVRLVTAVPVK